MSMKEDLESLIEIIDKFKNNELKRIDLHTDETQISIYKVLDNLVRIDVKFKQDERKNR